MLDLGLISAGVGIITSFLGDDAEEDAEKARIRAERKRDALLAQNTAQYNEVAKKIAKNKYTTAQKSAAVYEAATKDINKTIQAATDQINQYHMNRVAALNEASDARGLRIAEEYAQAKMNNLRERRENIRNTIMTISAQTAGAANKGALGGSGFKAGKADAGVQLTRANAASFINLGVLDTLLHADQMYQAAMTQSNLFEAKIATERNKMDADVRSMENAMKVKQLNVDVAGLERDYKLQESLFDIETKAATINSNANRKVSSAKESALEGSTISSIGSSVAQFGMNLFG